jgi:hypothetical protein
MAVMVFAILPTGAKITVIMNEINGLINKSKPDETNVSGSVEIGWTKHSVSVKTEYSAFGRFIKKLPLLQKLSEHFTKSSITFDDGRVFKVSGKNDIRCAVSNIENRDRALKLAKGMIASIPKAIANNKNHPIEPGNLESFISTSSVQLDDGRTLSLHAALKEFEKCTRDSKVLSKGDIEKILPFVKLQLENMENIQVRGVLNGKKSVGLLSEMMGCDSSLVGNDREKFESDARVSREILDFLAAIKRNLAGQDAFPMLDETAKRFLVQNR